MRTPLVAGNWKMNKTVAEARELVSMMKPKLQEIAKQHHGKVALFAENLKTGQSVALNPDEVIQTASTIKLTALVEAAHQIKDGKIAHVEPAFDGRPYAAMFTGGKS